LPPRNSLRRFLAATTGALLVTATAACAAEPSPEVAVRSFLLNWQEGDYEAAAQVTNGDVAEVAEALRQAHNQLDLAALRLSLRPIEMDGDTATAGFGAEADLGIGDPVWRYTGTIPLTRTDSGWVIDWSPAVIHPELGEGERLAVTYDVPDRGQIYDRNGEPLVEETEVTAFGVRPAAMADMTEGINSLAELLDEDPEPLLNRVRSAPPEEFQPLVLKRTQDVSSSLLAKATAIPGVEVEEGTMPLLPIRAAGVVGEVAGTAEHKVANRVSGPYQAGDTVGLNGLQSSFQQQLAGTATTRVVTLSSSGEETGVLETWTGEESGSLTTTLDHAVQEAAETSLATINGTAYLVAVDARSGEILAAAGQPDEPSNDGALTRQYYPGETFTIVSAAALLSGGKATLDTTMACEQQAEVGSRTFTNPNGGSLLGTPDLRTNFAYSCTTAFVGLSSSLSAADLAESAERFGIGQPWQLPVPAFSGEFTVQGGQEQVAAATVGADGITVSPLGMALVAAAVAGGQWHAPRLIDGVEPEVDSIPVDPAVLEPLRELMRAPVEQGSASVLNIDYVNPVHGQTGMVTQEIDGEEKTIQWFVGYRGHVAFAVVVEAAPSHTYQFAVNSALSFLQLLPASYVSAAEADSQLEGSA
jgi:cell division protein FtsI/penicillin-binding protein 2